MQGFRLFRYHSFKDQTRRGTHGFINQTRRRHFDELSCIYIIWIRINHGHVLYMISKYISIYYYIYYENKYIWYIIYYIYMYICVIYRSISPLRQSDHCRTVLSFGQDLTRLFEHLACSSAGISKETPRVVLPSPEKT